MGFNSIAFVVFAPLALAGNALLRGRAWRLWMVAASYVFYGWARPWYCLLLLASTLLDFAVGLALARSRPAASRKAWLAASLVGNLGLLAVFKYAALIAGTINDLAALAGTGLSVPVPTLPLPVGISFYTFQTLSYTIDVYRGKVEPTRSFTTFALYVAFFPQLVAGPIERAGHLLPQLEHRQPRTGRDLLEGTTRVFWGLVKKVVVADALGLYVARVYGQAAAAGGLELLVATYAFAFQLYLDFSAYSDIAIGLARSMGVHLRENFNWPYLARSPGEYWQRWHLSLSSWMRDYLYQPLGGSRGGTVRTIVNVTIVFALAGLWHGASWKFVLWGLYIAATVALMTAYGKLRGIRIDARPERPFVLADAAAILATFHVFCISKLIFRAESVAHAHQILARLVEWSAPVWSAESREAFWRAAALTAVAALAHVVRGLRRSDPTAWRAPPLAHGLFWGAATLALLLLRPEAQERFIYFQF